jgi:hypothetical protein
VAPFFGEKVLGMRGVFFSKKKIHRFGPSASPDSLSRMERFAATLGRGE